MNKTDPNKIKSGDLMAVIHYVKVKSSHPSSFEFYGDDVDQPGQPLKVSGKDLLERAFSADQYESEEHVSKTRAAELLVSSPNRPLSVCFTKQDGTQRTLRGRLVRPEPLLGRSMVEDLDAAPGKRIRQVDHRTIKHIILEGMKYVVN